MKYIKYIFLFLAFLGAIGFFTFHTALEKHKSSSAQEIEYVLEYDFLKVKKVMLRTNVLESIVEKEHGEIVDKRWDNFVFSTNRPLRDGIDIDAQGFFVVEKNDPDIGKIRLNFKQKIHTTKSEFKSETSLIESENYIKNIQTSLCIIPAKEKNKTLVKVKMILEYERLLPKNMITTVDKIVEKSVKSSLEANRQAVTDLVAQYADKQFILPLSQK